uniref:DNA-directed RNA polymerase subunit n=1 Tax=Steinernema glaseri TaxID=37863 RepID=A0A1I8AVE3_9BILA
MDAKTRLHRDPYVQLEEMQFRMYQPKEIKNMSVMAVTQTKTFDQLGFPVEGGLYDLRLGPFSSRDACKSCGLSGLDCPGHYGYLSLHVPVFNPMLFNFTYNLLKGTCVQCHQFTFDSKSGLSVALLCQLTALDIGWIAEALDIRQVFDADGAKRAQQHSYAPGVLGGLAEQVQTIEDLRETLKNDPKYIQARKDFIPTRNSVTVKNQILRDFLREKLFKRYVRCPKCKRRNGVMRNDNGRCILIDFSASSKSTTTTKKGSKNSKNLGDELGTTEIDLADFQSKDKVLDSELVSYDMHHSLDQQMQGVQQHGYSKLAWRASEVREHFRLLWKTEGAFLAELFPMFRDCADGSCPLDILFSDVVLVPPSKFRPIRMMKGETYEHPQTVNLRKLLEASEVVKAVTLLMDPKHADNLSLKLLVDSRTIGNSLNARLHNAYLELQLRMNVIFDQELSHDQNSVPGIRQILEKKQGLFRMNMMGKRVNFACRSVITPDPYLDIDEIGIPEMFAKKLTFPEPVNAFNVAKLRQLVINGPDNYPGANYILSHHQSIIPSGEENRHIRVASSKRLRISDSKHQKQTTVLRQLKKGDMLLMNRQPSLHKPSIMGHRARILKGQRALRMNYAPCKAYNADFDGDEMNGHLVQNGIAQTEVRQLANVGSNFLVPKDGTPILGLIQDHVVSGVLMTMRGQFFSKEDFMHLLLAAFAQTTKRLIIPEPAIVRPCQLWSGKQIVSAIILNNTPKGVEPITLEGKSKTPLTCWRVKGKQTPNLDMSEAQVIFKEGELLCGVLDKSHFGATQFGLIHCCYELYGPTVAVQILSCFSRVFTTYLQFHGFTLGVADILVDERADAARTKAIEELRTVGESVVRTTFQLDDMASEKKLTHVLATAYNNPRHESQDVQQLDYSMKKALDPFNKRITDACVPEGLIRGFPNNALQMMIQTGAKGSMVNSIQISCGLGQIELEGHRPPLTAAGRTLPSFKCFDPSPRAGGYVDQRFLTGINPQELFFHTMAGREGLIDTAVKTSRSGYLQRCIIKHLEGIAVHYDNTVRDHDGSVIQFRYGEDGLDVGRASFLSPKLYKFLEANLKTVRSTVACDGVPDPTDDLNETIRQYRKIQKWRRKTPGGKVYDGGFIQFAKGFIGVPKSDIVSMWFDLDDETKKSYAGMAIKKCPRTVEEKFSANKLGSLPEKMLDTVDSAVAQDNQKLKKALFWKAMKARVDPGENVGLLAAQSIGEPSTQMTLNTFHFAGRGEMNVTLGIPRLREILMTASKTIATPMAEVAVRDGVSEKQLESIRCELDRVVLKQLLRKFTVQEKIRVSDVESSRRYVLRIELLRATKRDQNTRHLKRHSIMREIEKRFIPHLTTVISQKHNEIVKFQQLQHKKLQSDNVLSENRSKKFDDDGASSDEEAEGGRDADAAEARLNQRHNDDGEYEGEDDDRNEVSEQTDQQEEYEEYGTDSEAEDRGKEDDEEALEKREDMSRIKALLALTSGIVVDYKYDTATERWCEVTFRYDLTNKTKLDVVSIIEKEVDGFVVAETPGVEKCIIREGDDGRKVLQTQGINLSAFYKHSAVLDVNTIYSNDIHLILNTFGIEACSRAIVKEMNNVFSVYGIEVSSRHLSLTADYMTHTGYITPFSRGAMAASSSPLQKMTFETTLTFLRDTLITGDTEKQRSASARIVSGQLIRGGTSAFDLLVDHTKKSKC